MKKNIVNKADNYSKWYNDLIVNADLAENSSVRGCMIIKPYGFSIWERMKEVLDEKLKETGHSNAYFPLFIPKSFIAKEAAHIEGFAKECAVVTHHRLTNDANGAIIVDPEAQLEEELIVRPTSETIIWNTYRGWINSYRDLPILVNQWANVVRWEMRPRLFLRTAEFLWQEGHTAHETEKEAIIETELMLDVYTEFAQDVLAIPVIRGKKTENERFAGAVETYCIEALMSDGKALQAGTSHFLGQNFARAFDVKFTNNKGERELVWATSWAVSSRLIGALVMVHSDSKGLVLPPKLAPIQVVLIPISKSQEETFAIDAYVHLIEKEFIQQGISCKYDKRDNHRPGFKFADWETKGVPLRISIGARDMQSNSVEVVCRDTGAKLVVKREELSAFVQSELSNMQQRMFQKALDFRENHITEVTTMQEFKQVLENKGGFISCFWDGTVETEKRVKEETKATIRCIPLDSIEEVGTCIFTGKQTKLKVLFAKAY